MMDDSESAPQFEAGFLRLLHATGETMTHLGKETPTSLVNADGSINRNHQMCESMWYRSGYGFNIGQFKPGPSCGCVSRRLLSGKRPNCAKRKEFTNRTPISRSSASILPWRARPNMPDINSFWNERMINHLVRFYCVKTGTSTVRDSKGQVNYRL